MPETKYIRPLVAYKGVTAEHGNHTSFIPISDPENLKDTAHVLTIHDQRFLDTINYAPRTRLSDLRIFVNPTDWMEAVRCLKHMFQLFWFPNVFWILSMNGIFLGVNIAMGLTYGNILTDGYHWANKYISVAQSGQVVVAFICIPMLGYGSDIIVKYMARRNGGVHEPEHRLLTLITPLLLGTMFAIIYGQAAAFPDRYHWLAIVIPLNGCKLPYFSVVGVLTFFGKRLLCFHRRQHLWDNISPRRLPHSSCTITRCSLRHARCD